jgi:hypothetical protein
MKKERQKNLIVRRTIFITGMILICGLFTEINGQPHPPRPIIVTFNSSQPLAFGAFTPGLTGGTVIINPGGSRSSTGDIVLFSLGYSFTPAMFYVQANPGTVISILNTPPVTLTGGGGGSMTLQVGGSLPASPFVTTLPWPQQTTVLIGGTLTVGDIIANPPGNYTGNFTVTFVQE